VKVIVANKIIRHRIKSLTINDVWRAVGLIIEVIIKLATIY